MPFAQFTGTGNGTTKQFTISFPYVKKDHIVVALNNVANTGFTFINDTTIEFDTLSSATSTQEATGAPKTGVEIEISRDTPLTTALVDFVDGSTLTAADLDTAVLQLLYGIQEAKDEAALGIQNTPQGQDANNKPIINVSDPTNAQDAVTKAFLERVGSITSTQIADGTIVNADVNASAAIDGTKISPDFGSQNIATSGTVDGRDVSADGTKLDGIESGATADQTNAEIKTAYEANSDTNNFTDALLAKLNAIEANATTDQTIAEIKSLIAGSPLDASHLAPDSVSTSEIANSSVTNNKLADAELVTLAGMPSGTASKLASSTELTSDIADLNQIDGLQKETVISDDDAKFPTSGAVVDYVAAQIAPLGGLEVIANEDSFPTTIPSPGVVISISDIEGLITDASGVAINARTTGNGSDNVTINGFPSSLHSKTMAAGLGLMVSSTGNVSGGQHVYTYHKLLAKEADVEQLSDDINDFKQRYRVVNTISEATGNEEGDLVYAKDQNKLLVYDTSLSPAAFKETQSVGNFFISTLSPAFDGSTIDFTLSNAPLNAQQVLLSIAGVIQKPNEGTSRPSEGFSLNGGTLQLPTGSAPASGTDYFAIVLGSTVNIATPSNNSVTEAIIQSNVVSEEKLKVSNSPVDGYFLQAQSGDSGGLRWAVVDLSNYLQLTGGSVSGMIYAFGGIELGAYDEVIFDSDNSNAYKIKFKGPLTLTKDSTYTLPEDGNAGEFLKTDGAGGLAFAQASSPEVYGFNTDSNGNLIVTSTNGGVDNISGAVYDAFEEVVFAATGFSFSLNASGRLIATI